ncbi:phenylalanine--tRNA ligase subunit alpha [soil metagenome]
MSNDALSALEGEIAAIRQAIAETPVGSTAEVEAFRVRFLGRKSGLINDLFGRMRDLPPDARRDAGQLLNALRAEAEQRLTASAAPVETSVSTGADLTLPGRPPVFEGSLHPITQTLREIERIFVGMGFSIETGPEIEDDWHNFSALAFPPEHPARDMQDTFFVEPPDDSGSGGVVLRTHTSPVQIRVLEREAPPIRVIAPGRVYRNEAVSYKSFCLFHQVEGLVVDEHATFADLKETLHVFARALFGSEVKMRFRPSFFPFTEPSAEVDIWWVDSNLPEGGRWLEILGCGMVDPDVLQNVGVDPERYTGYAFGMGVERMAMLKHGVDDIRVFYQNDVRFLAQF